MQPKLPDQSRRGRLVERHWAPNLGALGGRRARQAFTFQAYVPAPIADDEFPISASVAAEAANAEQACRELNDAAREVPSFENLARQLLRAESVASSRIEGLVLSHRRLAKASFSPDAGDLTAEGVLANIRAVEASVARFAQAGAVTVEDLQHVHQLLLSGTRDEHLGGVVRDEQNWIGGTVSNPRNAEFVPPPPEFVPDLLEDLCAFCGRADVPATIQAAIAHAQFETIHPFHDGNGRVGRALVLAILRRRGLAPHYLPPVSLVLAANGDRYIHGLTDWRAAEEESWYAVFLDAVTRASKGAESFGRDVAALQEVWRDQAGRPRKASGPDSLIDLLPANPVLNVKTAATLLGGTAERARLAILRLEDAGVLRQTTVGRRSRAWECVGLFDLLDRFERSFGPAGRTPRPTR